MTGAAAKNGVSIDPTRLTTTGTLRRGEGRLEGRAAGFELLVQARCRDGLQHRETRGGRQRVPRERPGLVARALGRQLGHDRRPAAECADRQAAADDLAVTGQVRGHAEALLRAAACDPEPGDDLVEDQQRPGPIAGGPRVRPGTRRPAGTTPMLPATGSTMIAAAPARAASAAARSL